MRFSMFCLQQQRSFSLLSEHPEKGSVLSPSAALCMAGSPDLFPTGRSDLGGVLGSLSSSLPSYTGYSGLCHYKQLS